MIEKLVGIPLFFSIEMSPYQLMNIDKSKKRAPEDNPSGARFQTIGYLYCYRIPYQ
jgi:hypothetical protein